MPVASYKPFESLFCFFSVSGKQHRTNAAVPHSLCCVNYTALSEGGSRNMRRREGSVDGCAFFFFHGQCG